jgi:hypothetical protein
MKRRSFLALMGAAPLAAKATADAEIAKQIGLNSGGLIQGGFGNQIGGASALGMADGGSYEQRITGAAEYIKMFGMPESIARELRENTRYVGALDPDIACKKSWSMSVKLMTQRQRQYDRQVENMTGWGWQMKGREALRKALGFQWPW